MDKCGQADSRGHGPHLSTTVCRGVGGPQRGICLHPFCGGIAMLYARPGCRGDTSEVNSRWLGARGVGRPHETGKCTHTNTGSAQVKDSLYQPSSSFSRKDKERYFMMEVECSGDGPRAE